MGKFHIYLQILQGNALFSGKIYTVGNIFTRPPVVMVATNFKSGFAVIHGIMIISSDNFDDQEIMIVVSNNFDDHAVEDWRPCLQRGRSGR